MVVSRFDAVPNEILVRIFSYCLPSDLMIIKLVCKRFSEIAHEPSLYENTFEALRMRFPLVAGHYDGQKLNTYEKTVQCAKQICILNGQTKGDDLWKDVAAVLPQDDQLLIELNKRVDEREVERIYDICKAHLTFDPLTIVQKLLCTIGKAPDFRSKLQWKTDWMLVYALKRYVEDMPKSCMQMLFDSLPSDDIYLLVFYLYPLGINLRKWITCGLNPNLQHTQGNHLMHLIIDHLGRIQCACNQDDLQNIVPLVAFTKPWDLIEALKEHRFLARVSSLLVKKPSAFESDIENTENNAEELALQLECLQGRGTPELANIAMTCDDLVRSTKNIARSSANRKRKIEDPNKNSGLIKKIRQTLTPERDRTIDDLRFLNLIADTSLPNQHGLSCKEIICQNAVCFPKKQYRILTEIFDPPLRSSR